MTKTFSVYRSSAGSGKTRTLARAYLKLALQFRADYFKHILAVTFTNRASQEMKDRILQYLDDFAQGRDNELADELKRELSMDALTFRQRSQEVQSTLLHHYDNFAISTIDAFFQKVIRSFTREAGLVGDYRLEVDQDAVLEEVIDNLIDELGANKELTDWVVEFAKENLENERSWDVRFSLIEFAKEIFREEFKEVEDGVNKATAGKDFFRNLMERLWSVKNGFIKDISSPARESLQIIQSKGWTSDDFRYGKNSGLLSFFRAFAFEKNLSRWKPPGERIRNFFSGPENWPNKKSPWEKDILQAATEQLVPRLNAIVDTYDRRYQQALSVDVVLKNMYVFGLITDISRKLKEYKDENNIMLLADAPKFLNGVIRDSDTPFIYEKVGSFYRNYLIDEFQDTSGLQWQNFQPLIVNSLDQGYASLVVGDVKQAIYRWRGGDLNLLQEKIIDLIGRHRVDAHELANNFRSASEIVQFNNALFKSASQVLSLQAGIPLPLQAYSDVEQMVSSGRSGFVEIRFLSEDPLPPNGEENGPRQSWKEAALGQLPVMLENLQERGVELKDIAVLVRKNDEGQKIASWLLQYKNSPKAKLGCRYDVVSNESLRIDGAGTVNLLLGAMRYLLNADDSIARAQLGYEFARLHEPERDLSDVFAVSNQSVFENNLPSSFTKEKLALKKLPLIELTETLIDIFRLGTVSGELVYLQAFQDLVLEFGNRERNDLGSFLEWWEANRHKKSIQISGEVNAVQILTIHKSKGLQFKYVIIPFCSWSLDHEKWQAPNLWVKSDAPPFEEAGYLPVKYSRTLEETFFSDFYSAERAKICLDNLNLLYVAFTRAESGMMVCAPSIDTRAAKNSIAEMLYQSIQANEALLKYWNADDVTLRSGELNADARREKSHTDSLALEEYLTSPWRDKLVIRKAGASWFGDAADEQRRKLNYGIHMHAVLSRMRFADEMDEVLEQIVREGLISISAKEDVQRQLESLLRQTAVSSWFSHDWEVRTEVPVLLPDGEENRMDRLMVKERKAVVVDYKTGARKKSDEKQVLQYIDILRKMNFPEVEGYLLYLAENEVIEVKPGTKSKRVQTIKDRDQLDLGF